MTTALSIKPKLRLLNPAKLARISESVLNRLRDEGNDVPVRLVTLRNDKAQLPVPWFVRRELYVVKDSPVVFCWTAESRTLDVAEVSVIDQRDVDGRPILGEVVARSKVRKDGRSFVITIPKGAQVVLGDVVWRFLEFGLTNYPGKVTLKIFETEASACRLTSTLPECLRKWPSMIKETSAAWRTGFEPFLEALEDTMIPPPYAKRDPRNINRAAAVNEIMIETANSQAELRRRKQWSS